MHRVRSPAKQKVTDTHETTRIAAQSAVAPEVTPQEVAQLARELHHMHAFKAVNLSATLIVKEITVIVEAVRTLHHENYNEQDQKDGIPLGKLAALFLRI